MRKILIFALLLAPLACETNGTVSKDGTKAETPKTEASKTENTKNYKIAVSTDLNDIKTGEEGHFDLKITPSEGWVLKTVTPMELKLQSTDKLTLGTEMLGSKDMVDAESAAKTMRTSLKVSAAGEHSIETDLMFFLCTDKICQRFNDKNKFEFKTGE
ncbi:hypothetical protein KAI87_16270 [Myxococcota bacterium]|nr:hypothetical protein [Myxococcota bacterium]